MTNPFYQKSLISVDNLKRADIELVFNTTRQMRELVEKKGGDDRLKRKILAALFFEPSSRTFSSFISAMQRLGGGIIPLPGMSFTSIAKGETLQDTARVFSKYADVLVVRHPEPGSVALVSNNSEKPVINAGDGINEHPSQALIDIVTIMSRFGNPEKIHILMIGDLAHYRPTNSLSKLLALFPGVRLSLATPAKVPLPENIREYLKAKNVDFREYNDFTDLIPETDVLYVTRVKKEYMEKSLYEEIKGSYKIDKRIVSRMKKGSLIMHCLPRIDEIAREVDTSPQSIYLSTQLENSLFVRMALLDLILRK